MKKEAILQKYKKILLSVALLANSYLAADSAGQVVPENKIDKVETAKNIVRMVLSETDGYLTKPLYDFYWKNMKNASPEDKEKMRILLQDMPHLQLMVWQSVEKSIEKEKEVYVSGLLEELKNLDSKTDVIPRTRELISSAAHRTPFKFGEKNVVFTLPQAKQFVNNWSIVEERGLALSDKNFEFKKLPHKLTENLTIDSVFIPNRNNINIMYGYKQLQTHGFSTRFGEKRFMLVSETKDSVKFQKDATKSCVDGFFKTIRVFDDIHILTKGKSSFALKTFQSVLGNINHLT